MVNPVKLRRQVADSGTGEDAPGPTRTVAPPDGLRSRRVSGIPAICASPKSHSHPNAIYLRFVFNGLRFSKSESRAPRRYCEGGKREFGPASLPAILNISPLVPTRSARASFTHSGFPQPFSRKPTRAYFRLPRSGFFNCDWRALAFFRLGLLMMKVPLPWYSAL